jgi:hypothetical protein
MQYLTLKFIPVEPSGVITLDDGEISSLCAV